MAVAANEPYRRVTKDNGVLDGALIGTTIGVGGVGAGMFGARMRYNGIEKRSARDMSALTDKKSDQVDRIQRVTAKQNKAKQKYRGTSKSKKVNEKAHKKLQKMGAAIEKTNKLMEQVGDVDGIKARHAYSRMGGGFKKAGIIGAAAIVGAGTGMLADGINN